MSKATIISYGLRPVATFRISEEKFDIQITDRDLVIEECCIYAFVFNDEIVRIGSSKAKLMVRLNAWKRDVSAALQGRKSPTPASEADGWRDLLGDGVGTIFARPGTCVDTPVGKISAYLAEETALISRHRPRFCRR